MWAAQLSLVPREMSLLGAFPAFPFPKISANSAGCQGSVTAQHPNQQTQQIQRTGRHRRMLGWHLAEQHWASTQHGLFTVRQPPTSARLRARFIEAESISSSSSALVLLVASTSSIAWFAIGALWALETADSETLARAMTTTKARTSHFRSMAGK